MRIWQSSLALFLLGTLPIHLHGADWPRWRGPFNIGHAASGESSLSSLPAEPQVVWEIPAHAGLSSPVVAGGRLLLFDNPENDETLRAVDATTGRELWSVAVDKPFSDSQGPTGPRNTPVIDGDRAYAVSCRGELQCRRMSDGSLVWRVNYVIDFEASFIGEKGNTPGAARHGNTASPLVDGKHLLACVGGTNGAGVVCFDKENGEVVWKSTSDQAGYAPPVVAVIHDLPQVIVYTVNGIVGLRRDTGELLWRVPVKTAFARHVTTPIVQDDLVVVSSHEEGLIAIRVRREGAEWSATRAWTNKKAAVNYSSPVARDGFLYGVGPEKDLFCAEIASGEIRWVQRDYFVTSAGKAHAGLIVLGSNILILTDSGELVLFEATPESYRELGRAQVCAMNWCNPAYAEGVLYVRDGLRDSGSWRALRLSETSGSR